MKPLLTLFAAACALAQPGIERPQLGQMLDSRGALWPVYGVPGSFLLTQPRALGIVSMACSRLLCVAKTEFSVVANTTSVAAPRGPALIALDGAAAWLYFPLTREFAQWSNAALSRVTLPVDGQVLALGPGPRVAVRRPDGVWIVRPDGTILDSLPISVTAVFLSGGTAVYALDDSLVLRHGATELRFAAPGVTSLLQMGDGWIEARSGSAIYGLRIDPGREALFHLPQPSGATRP